MIRKLLCRMGLHFHSYKVEGFREEYYLCYEECRCGHVYRGPIGVSGQYSPGRMATWIDNVRAENSHPEFDRLSLAWREQS